MEEDTSTIETTRDASQEQYHPTRGSGPSSQIRLQPTASAKRASTRPIPLTSLPKRLVATSHPQYKADVTIPPSHGGRGRVQRPTWNELPLRKDDGTTGISPHSHIAASTTYGGFLANFRPDRDHLYKAVPVDERTGSKVYDENAKDVYSAPEVLLGEEIGSGEIWRVFEGKIRLPEGALINGVAPGEPDDTSRWSVPVVRAAFSRAVDKSRQDFFDEGYVTSDKEEGWATDEEAKATKMGFFRREKGAKAAPRTGPRPTYVEPPPLTAPLSRVWADMLRRNDVAIKFACPAKAAVDRGSRPESASIEAANDWRSSAEAIERRILNEARVYTSKLQSVQGIYAPAFYGLWSFELAEGRVYMMVLEQLHPLKQEGIDLARPVQPLWVQRAICNAYTAVHIAGVIMRQVQAKDLMVRYDPTSDTRSIIKSISPWHVRKNRPDIRPALKLINFDQAVDISSMSSRDREAAIQAQRTEVSERYGLNSGIYGGSARVGREWET